MPKIPTATAVRKKKATPKPEPVWKGPEVDGITFSLLSRFLCCRERFRLLVVEGLRPVEEFNHRIDYGNMWHVCEETFASEKYSELWCEALEDHCYKLAQKYLTQGPQIEHWYRVCKTQFPIYVDYWSKHPDIKDRTPLLQEQVFDIPYKLPSGRTVRLRGKWDSIDWVGKGKHKGLYLQENKSKGDIDEQQLKRQLSFDLQTCLYLVAMIEQNDNQGIGNPKFLKPLWDDIGSWQHVIKGVRYNVIRRPLSGGKHSIKQHQPTKSNPDGESSEAFYKRLGELIAGEPEYFFMRWKVEIIPSDIERFKRECLNPILEQLCDWWQVAKEAKAAPWGPDMFNHIDARRVHYRLPYGCYNPLSEGRSSELDEYLATGSTLGLEKTTNLFRELT